MRTRAIAVVLLTTLAGCAARDTSAPVAPATGAGAVAETDCGTFELKQGEELAGSAQRCFIDAVAAGRTARLQVTKPTAEGNPIPVSYRADTQRRVEVITDYRRDGFSSKEVMRQVCTGPAPALVHLRFADCTEPKPVDN